MPRPPRTSPMPCCFVGDSLGADSFGQEVFVGRVSSLGARSARASSAAHELREEAVEVMYTALSRRRVTSALVEARAHSELHGLDDDLVFALNAIETRARSGVALARVPHEWEERDARPVDGQGRDQVHRPAPRVPVEPRGREEPE